MVYISLIYVFLLVGPAIAAIAFFRRLSTRWHLFLLSLCVVYGISPLLVTWGALGLAKRFGCSAEAVGFRCPDPVWLGDAISGLVMSHWLAIFTIPSAVLGAIGLLFSWILQQQRSRTTGATSGKPPTAFYRSRRHKVIAGICSALAQRWHQSLPVMRIVAVVLLNVESIGRIFVFAMPAFFSVGISTTTQRRGLVLYLAGVILYYLSYGTQNFFPNSDWSTSTIGFAASAYTNVFWTIGLGLLGEKFYFTERLHYRPIFYIAPAVIFIIFHTIHAVIYHQRSF